MEQWDLWLHLVKQKEGWLGPRGGDGSLGDEWGREPQDRMTVSAAQQLLGTQCQSSPAGGAATPEEKVMYMGTGGHC